MQIQKKLKGLSFEKGYEIFESKGFAIVGMSPGNSYFKKEIIKELLIYCSKNFSKVVLMIPDKPARYTFSAFGYPENKSKKKARLSGNLLRNHSKRIIEEFSLNNVQILDWEEDIESSSYYVNELRKLEKMYCENSAFKSVVDNTTTSVLEGNLKEGVELEYALSIGVNYLLNELAFLSSSPKIFSVNNTAYVYHEPWEIYESFVKGKFDNKKRDDLGFCVIV